MGDLMLPQTLREPREAMINDWVSTAGFRIASRGKFIAASAVVAAARSATGAIDTDAFLSAMVLRALTKACGVRVERTKGPYSRQANSTVIYWGVTCESMPATTIAAPDRPLTTRPNKKGAKEARRAAQHMPPADPDRLRILPRERGVVVNKLEREAVSTNSSDHVMVDGRC